MDSYSSDHSLKRLFASASALAQAGPIAAELPALAGMDVILISRDDVLSFVPPPILSPSLFNIDFDTHQRIDLLSQAFRSIAPRVGYDYHPKSLNTEDTKLQRLYEASAIDAVNNAPSVVAFNAASFGRGPNTLCVISVEKPEEWPEQLQHDTGIQDPVQFGLRQDQLGAFMMRHEAGHCGQAFNAEQPKLEREARADQFAINSARAAMADRSEFRRQAQQFINWRILETFHNMDASHASGPALRIEKEQPDFSLGKSFDPTIYRSQTGPYNAAIKNIFSEILGRAAILDISLVHAKIKVQSDPAYMYSLVTTLDAEERFEKDSIEDRYVKQYLSVAQQYGLNTPYQPSEAPKLAPPPSLPAAHTNGP